MEQNEVLFMPPGESKKQATTTVSSKYSFGSPQPKIATNDSQFK